MDFLIFLQYDTASNKSSSATVSLIASAYYYLHHLLVDGRMNIWFRGKTKLQNAREKIR